MSFPLRASLFRVPAVLLPLLAALLWLAVQPASAVTGPSTGSVHRSADYGALPLLFIPNQGQFDNRVVYAVEGRDKSIFFGEHGLTFVLGEQTAVPSGHEPGRLRQVGPPEPVAHTPQKRWALKVDFVDANPAVRPETLEQAETLISYFKGRPEEWRTGLQASRRIIYRDLWPGIDLIYSGTVNRLKYDFIVHPGADPDRIKLAWRGVDSVQVTPEGQLAVTTPLGTLRDEMPKAWQEAKGRRENVTVAYGLQGTAGVQVASLVGNGLLAGTNPHERVHIVSFTVGGYDRTRTLMLDPEMLVYCGFIGGAGAGGNGDDRGTSIAVDSSGNAYVTGYTMSAEKSFPINVGPDLSHNGKYDAFVAKVKADGTGLEYSGFIGGDDSDVGLGVAVDTNGSAYVTGATWSYQYTFPAKIGPNLKLSGFSDAFVAKVYANGTGLEYCGFIGGYGYDDGNGISVDSIGNAYIVGYTSSSEDSFPVTVGPDISWNGSNDAFVAKVKADGTGLEYSGFIGGTGADKGYGIAVDNTGNAYVTGYTTSTEDSFPVTVGPDLSFNGNYDAFVAKVKADGTGLEYSGFIGGTGTDEGYGIAVDNTGNAYVTGMTTSTEASFPVTAGPDLTYNKNDDSFVAKVKVDGKYLEYCGYIGGAYYDEGYGIAVDNSGNAYVTGVTASTETSFPVLLGPELAHGGDHDAFVAKVKVSGTGLVYCGFIGGADSEAGRGIAVDPDGNAYIIGRTSSTEASFPVTVGPDLIYNGDYFDAFVTKITMPKDDFPWPAFLPAIMEGGKKK